MASLKSPLLRRLGKVLSQRFPPPASVKLEDHDGIIGVITSVQFAGMETIDRQNLIGDLVATHLSQEERRQVLVIVGVTPDEGTGYLAGEE
jgi:stress-induced morphogen